MGGVSIPAETETKTAGMTALAFGMLKGLELPPSKGGAR